MAKAKAMIVVLDGKVIGRGKVRRTKIPTDYHDGYTLVEIVDAKGNEIAEQHEGDASRWLYVGTKAGIAFATDVKVFEDLGLPVFDRA